MTRTVGVFASIDPPLRTDRDVPAAAEELFDAERHENEEAKTTGMNQLPYRHLRNAFTNVPPFELVNLVREEPFG